MPSVRFTVAAAVIIIMYQLVFKVAKRHLLRPRTLFKTREHLSPVNTLVVCVLTCDKCRSPVNTLARVCSDWCAHPGRLRPACAPVPFDRGSRRGPSDDYYFPSHLFGDTIDKVK